MALLLVSDTKILLQLTDDSNPVVSVRSDLLYAHNRYEFILPQNIKVYSLHKNSQDLSISLSHEAILMCYKSIISNW